MKQAIKILCLTRSWARCIHPVLNGLQSKEENMFGIGIPELIIILVIVLIIFGANKLPEIGAGMGKAIKNFKKATSEPDEIEVSPEKEKVSPSESKEKESSK